MNAYWRGLLAGIAVAAILFWMGAPWWAAYISISTTYVLVQVFLGRPK